MGHHNLTPNTESVEEVRVVANNFSAVDGRNTGAQIQVITKAGTNQFRGRDAVGMEQAPRAFQLGLRLRF